MHVRSCCFARIKHIVFFYVLVAVRVVPYLIVRRPIAKIPQLWGRALYLYSNHKYTYTCIPIQQP